MRPPRLTDTERIQAHLKERYPEARQKVFRDFVLHLWELFQKYDLQDRKFVKEFTSEKIETHIQCYSEMLFAWHFINLGYTPTSKNEGPDLCIDHNGQRIWIEIIAPELTFPTGESAEAKIAAMNIRAYQAPFPKKPKRVAPRVPSKQILLRWTAALREKHNKLTSYLEKGIVKPGDPFLVAVNSILLGHCGFTGISQWPNPVEATFAVGPIGVTLSRKNFEVINSALSYRPDVVNHNQANVPADTFLDSSYKGVSGIIATHVGLEAATQPKPPSPLVIVHNPNAVNSLPTCIFGAEEEYVAEDTGEEWEIRDIHANT